MYIDTSGVITFDNFYDKYKTDKYMFTYNE